MSYKDTFYSEMGKLVESKIFLHRDQRQTADNITLMVLEAMKRSLIGEISTTSGLKPEQIRIDYCLIWGNKDMVQDMYAAELHLNKIDAMIRATPQHTYKHRPLLGGWFHHDDTK